MKNYSVAASTAFALFVSFMLGCALPPAQELQTAKASLDSASAVQANTYAPSYYKKAKDTLDCAIAEIEKQNVGSPLKQNYDKAKTLLAAATAAANVAKAQAAEGKKKALAEANAALTNVNTLLTEVKGLIEKTPKEKSNADTLKGAIANIETSIGEAQAANGSGDYIKARDKANACLAKLDSLKNTAAAAAAEFTFDGRRMNRKINTR